MKLYKFRSLGDDGSFERVKQILETGEFYCSKLWDQNDPMEGVYSCARSEQHDADTQKVFDSKNQFLICSFSGVEALSNPTIWGYYANGLKGVAIEVEVDGSCRSIVKMKYSDEPAQWQEPHSEASLDDKIESIIATKLKYWEKEYEYRFLIKGTVPTQKIGDITGVYFGDPYHGLQNKSEVVANSSWVKKYPDYEKELSAIAEKHQYPRYSSSIGRHGNEWKVIHARIK